MLISSIVIGIIILTTAGAISDITSQEFEPDSAAYQINMIEHEAGKLNFAQESERERFERFLDRIDAYSTETSYWESQQCMNVTLKSVDTKFELSCVGQCTGGDTNTFHGSDCYEAYYSPTEWNDAAQTCRDKGGHLVTIESSSENDAVHNLLSTEDAWIGYTDNETEGDWEWITGETSSYTNWASGEPDSQTPQEDIAEMYHDSGEWNDQAPSDRNHFVCEYN